MTMKWIKRSAYSINAVYYSVGDQVEDTISQFVLLLAESINIFISVTIPTSINVVTARHILCVDIV